MIKILLSVIIIFILIIFQTSLYPYLEVGNAFPNLILILVLVLSILKGYKKSLAWIIIGGLFLDIFSFNNPIGISILGLFLIGYLAYFFSQNIFKKSGIFPIILIAISGTLIYRLVLILVLFIAGINFQLSFKQLLFQIIYNVIILIPLFYLVKKITSRQINKNA